MAELIIRRAARAGDCECMFLIHEGVNELVQEGLTAHHGLEFPVEPGDSVIYGVSDQGDHVGVICYRKHFSVWEVSLAYVEPSSRRLRVMRRMWQELLNDARKAHVVAIQFTATTNNKTAMIVIDKLKGQVVASTYEVSV